MDEKITTNLVLQVEWYDAINNHGHLVEYDWSPIVAYACPANFETFFLQVHRVKRPLGIQAVYRHRKDAGFL